MTHVSSSLLKLCFDNNQAKKIVVVFLKIQNLPILSVNKMLDRIVKTKGIFCHSDDDYKDHYF